MIGDVMCSLYISDEKNIIVTSIKNIAKITECQIDVYVHNLNFDGLLILNEISKNKIKFSMTANKTNLYLLEIFFGQKIIRFRCSYKILPLSLRELGSIAQIEKTYFPYKFVNEKNFLYEGVVPDKKY
jgi:hypothetical protein